MTCATLVNIRDFEPVWVPILDRCGLDPVHFLYRRRSNVLCVCSLSQQGVCVDGHTAHWGADELYIQLVIHARV